jgi:hypothetical protein
LENRKSKRLIAIFVVLGLFAASLIPVISGQNISNTYYDNSFISFEDAQKVAEVKISTIEIEDFFIIDSFDIKNDKNFALMYIFKLTPKGYIVVSGHSSLPPIIAFSFSNDLGIMSDENVLLQLLKADISSRVEHIDQVSTDTISNHYEQWQKYLTSDYGNQQIISTKIIGPLLETQWSQNSPYKDFCPIDKDTGDRSVAGCPAVAMAQILNYHRTTQNVKFTDDDDYFHNYAGNVYKIDDDFEEYVFPSFPELNVYLDTLQYNYENDIPITDDDKAAINFACGVAAKQVYHPTGSGTFGVNQAYQAYQRFNFEDVELLQESSDFYDRLQANIENGFPAHIAVVNDAWTSGHNMVIDGYDTEGFFHINFGWGGSYDGWYMLPKELPYELTVLEGLVVDIKPTSENAGLVGEGLLNWANVPAGKTVKGDFIIRNVGSPVSSIDWEVISWPEWGTWTFSPSSGEVLTPESGDITIDVTVVAPDEQEKDFAGYIKIANVDDSSDYCLIHISLTTPKNYQMKQIFMQILENHPLIYNLILFFFD